MNDSAPEKVGSIDPPVSGPRKALSVGLGSSAKAFSSAEDSRRRRMSKRVPFHWVTASPHEGGEDDLVSSQYCGTARHKRQELAMAWVTLVVAGLLEVGWAIGLKYTDGFTRPLPSLLTVVSMIASIVLLGLALKTLPVGTAYAVWTGIGTIGTAILGIMLFAEPATVLRLSCIGLIVAGIVGLKLAT
jgi:quaternary ammonium compound-resistance protein SugE